MSEEVRAFVTMHQMIAAARQKATQDVWNYITGAAETETTMRRNRHALDCLALRPRVLRDVSNIDPTGSLLGHRLRIPVVLAPIGSLQTITPEGGVAVARAAAEFGVITLVSTVTEPSLEDIAATSGARALAGMGPGCGRPGRARAGAGNPGSGTQERHGPCRGQPAGRAGCQLCQSVAGGHRRPRTGSLPISTRGFAAVAGAPLCTPSPTSATSRATHARSLEASISIRASGGSERSAANRSHWVWRP